MQLRLVERLLNSQIDGAGNDIFNLLIKLVRKGAVRNKVTAHDLNIERRRQSEIENLGDDIGRQERKSRLREIASASFRRRS